MKTTVRGVITDFSLQQSRLLLHITADGHKVSPPTSDHY